MEQEFTIVLSDPDVLAKVCGTNDSNLKLIEKYLGTPVFTRGNEISISDEDTSTRQKFKFIIDRIFDEVSEAGSSGLDLVQSILNTAFEGNSIKNNFNAAEFAIEIPGGTKKIYPKTINQAHLVESFRKNDLVFAEGPAGTGKTFLAVAECVRLLHLHKVSHIILTRPVVEAGENLGFLPGDLQDKINPYLRPLYDALYQIMGSENFMKNMEKGAIEVAPLAYMRGRTLDNAYIILDEAQNTTPAQMKMFLTRIGFGSKVIVTGDATQKDLAPGTVSGLDVAQKVLKDIDDIAVCALTSKDVVRHPLVQKIVKAYEDYEKKETARSQRKAAIKRDLKKR